MTTLVRSTNPSFDFDTHSPVYQAFERKAICLDLREGATIFHPDQRQDSLYFVKKGVLRSYIRHDEVEITRWFYSPGDLACSALTFLYGLPSDICLEAACPSVVMQIYKEDYLVLCGEYPDFKEFTNRLQGNFLYKHARYNDSMKSLSRIERYEKFMHEFPSVNLHVKVRDLASFLGMTPDTLSKIRKQFKDLPSKNNPTSRSNRG
ncbi:Crp/Fnr family transcriptional regulator [Dyadobacter sp. CY323]|uniref:Crp/Fnr family transcriptional regulator n=1 Tax=Dyadobacter sp. CY323 TaxID=2907302 RepID=UPI001F4432CD|nr:Crp/Fnr family transcriptional regulator [Dyadobacter sp. CY323]MCE6988873.1 Crp/Fnr family transcriptional regulator [Dyadobacter sp. CY323]